MAYVKKTLAEEQALHEDWRVARERRKNCPDTSGPCQTCLDSERRAAEALIGTVLAWLYHHARRMYHAGVKVPCGDLVAAGVLGVLHAARKYAPGRNTLFRTYAICWARSYMQREAHFHRYPLFSSSRLLHLTRKRCRVRLEEGRELSLEETAGNRRDRKTVPLAHVAAAERALAAVASLQRPVTAHRGNDVLADTLPDPTCPDPLDEADKQSIRSSQHALLSQLLSTLLPRWRLLLKLRWGLGLDEADLADFPTLSAVLSQVQRGEEWTLATVAEVYGISRERARQLEHRALRELWFRVSEMRKNGDRLLASTGL